MRKAKVFMHNQLAGHLIEVEKYKAYRFEYENHYNGMPVSLTMPVQDRIFTFSKFPPFFEGLLPEGSMLEGLLRYLKADRKDYFSQIVAVGEDLVGAVTVKPVGDE